MTQAYKALAYHLSGEHDKADNGMMRLCNSVVKLHNTITELHNSTVSLRVVFKQIVQYFQGSPMLNYKGG